MRANVTLATTEYTRPQGIGSTAPIVHSKLVNSIHTVQEQGATEQASVTVETSKLDELLEKMCSELNNSKITPEQLKNSGILYRITGCNEYQLTQKRHVLSRMRYLQRNLNSHKNMAFLS